MIDRAVFNRQIAVLAEMHRHVLSGPTIDEYYALLSPRMTTEQFVQMCRRLEMSAKAFWPLPGDFLPPPQERLGTAELDAAARLEGLPVPQRAAALPSGPVLYRDKSEHAPELIGAIIQRVEGAP